MSRKPELASILLRLPTKFVYLKAISQCFEDTYYKYHYCGRGKELKGPGPDRCLVSNED
ncbi:unnamed protein product [Heligmosomoides polygyrus]|uniref:Uncharacterized protein n=1 Tax=Heligmosomoides polygyrus TaxID=6339 RepID=A0A183FC70_HELPZ|nr:unnamed protein product [Heligmosomoides polygyrus]